MDLIRRYFVCNTAPVFSARRLNSTSTKYIPYRIGNARGFYWGRWHVSWRLPYLPCWQLNAEAQRWEIVPEVGE